MIIAADFGGTRIKIGIVKDGVVLANTAIKSYGNTPTKDWLPHFYSQIRMFCENNSIFYSEAEGMVWALPLVIASDLRSATCSFGKFEDTKNPDFCDQVEEVFGVPLLLENDARAAVVGEWQKGAGGGFEDLAMITLGTGIGTAVIQGNRPLRGRNGMAGNLGGLSLTHLGAKGSKERLLPACIESQVATWAIPDKIRNHKEFENSALSQEEVLDYLAVFTKAAEGDALALQFQKDALESWSALAVNLIQAYDVQCILVGGGIMESRDVIIPAIQSYVNEHAVIADEGVEVKASTCKDVAALYGCEWVWRANQGKRVLSV